MLTQTGQQIEDWLDAVTVFELGGANLVTTNFNTDSYTIPAITGSSSSNYNNINLFDRELYPNQEYTFQVGSSSVLAGSTTNYSVLVYDLDSNTGYGNYSLPISTSLQKLTFTTPNITKKLSLLVYSGTAGSTDGISIRLNNFMLEIGNQRTKYVSNYEVAFSKLDTLIANYNDMVVSLVNLEQATQ